MPSAFTRVAYESADDLVFGSALRPVRLANGITIGGGRVSFLKSTSLFRQSTSTRAPCQRYWPSTETWFQES